MDTPVLHMFTYINVRWVCFILIRMQSTKICCFVTPWLISTFVYEVSIIRTYNNIKHCGINDVAKQISVDQFFYHSVYIFRASQALELNVLARDTWKLLLVWRLQWIFFAKNIVLTSPFWVKLGCCIFRTDGWHYTSTLETQYAFWLFVYLRWSAWPQYSTIGQNSFPPSNSRMFTWIRKCHPRGLRGHQ